MQPKLRIHLLPEESEGRRRGTGGGLGPGGAAALLLDSTSKDGYTRAGTPAAAVSNQIYKKRVDATCWNARADAPQATQHTVLSFPLEARCFAS